MTIIIRIKGLNVYYTRHYSGHSVLIRILINFLAMTLKKGPCYGAPILIKLLP